MHNLEQLIEWQQEELHKPFDFQNTAEHVIERVSDKQINLRQEYVRARLIEIYGHHGWSEQDLELSEVENSKDEQGFYTVAYRARQRLIVYPPELKGGSRSFDGAGAWGRASSKANRVSVWELHSDVINGARSVAFCRAAKSLGTQFGLSFYSNDATAFKVRYSLPLRFLKEQAEMNTKAEQLDLTSQRVPDPDEDDLGFDKLDPAQAG